MCGIAGRVGSHGGPYVHEMVAALRHRGPDSDGCTTSGNTSLGMRRLRVLDLSPSGDQPMRGHREDVVLVYNGELYNHVELRRELEQHGHMFRSQTDTEVVVRGYEQWGDDVVLRLRGMFAFAVWDGRRGRLLLARDRLGIKPLYVRDEPDGGLRFASEAHALGSTGAIDRVAVASFLRLGWVGRGATIQEGIREVPPGHLLVHEDGRSQLRCYWTPTWRDAPADVEALRDALRDSVARHLIADVPVGVFLSAGLDSTAVASIAAEHDAQLRTYTVAFDGGRDEAQPARCFATSIGAHHDVVRLSASTFTEGMPQLVAAMDQPTVDGANSWAISRAVRDAGVTVALSGLGGDELFSGYSTFRRAPQIAQLGQRAPRAALEFADRTAGRTRRLRYGRVRRSTEAAGRGGLPTAYAGVRGLLPWAELSRLWPGGSDVLDRLDDEALLHTHHPESVAALEVDNYLRYQLLRDTDVMSMAHSLEVRVPLLDDRVVEAALALRPTPEGLSGKALLAAAAGPAVAAAAARPKATFTLPFDRWMRAGLRTWTTSSLDSLAASPLGFSPDALSSANRAFDAGHLHWRPLYALAVLGAWLEQRAL